RGSPGPAGPASAGATGGAGASAGGPISLSTPSEARLETIDGSGPALAGRIIEYRDTHGGFRSIDELKQVSGIGDKRFETLRKAMRPYADTAGAVAPDRRRGARDAANAGGIGLAPRRLRRPDQPPA